jgi:anti-anti-sigma factor
MDGGTEATYRADVVHLNGSAIVRLAGEIDMAARAPILDIAHDLLEGDAARPLVLDMEAVTFLDSNGIGCLIELHRAAVDAKTTMEIRQPSEAVLRVLTLGGVVDFLHVTEAQRTETSTS